MIKCRPRWSIDLFSGSDDTLLDLDNIRCWLRQNIRRGYKTGACHNPLSRSFGARISILVSRDTDFVMIRMAFSDMIVSSVDPSGNRQWYGYAAKMIDDIHAYHSIINASEIPDPAIGTIVYDTITGSMNIMADDGLILLSC